MARVLERLRPKWASQSPSAHAASAAILLKTPRKNVILKAPSSSCIAPKGPPVDPSWCRCPRLIKSLKGSPSGGILIQHLLEKEVTLLVLEDLFGSFFLLILFGKAVLSRRFRRSHWLALTLDLQDLELTGRRRNEPTSISKRRSALGGMPQEGKPRPP